VPVIKKIYRRLFHWFIALCLLPVAFAALVVLWRMLCALGGAGWREWWIYAMGAGGYLLLEWLFKKPMWAYVVGHELTHAFTGVMTGAKVHSIEATARKGQVKLSKTNWFIAISPYIVPFYTLLLLGLYALLNHYWPQGWLTITFQLLMGASLAFHISLTIMAFHGRQTDLKVLGFVLSFVLIVLGNTLILGVLTVSLFGVTPPIAAYFSDLGKESCAASKAGTQVVWRTAQKTPRVFQAITRAAKAVRQG